MAAPLPSYIVFGEALTDLIREPDGRWSERPGGSCWNVARMGARLGIATGCAAAVSNDPFGTAIMAASREVGLDLRCASDSTRCCRLASTSSCPTRTSLGR